MKRFYITGLGLVFAIGIFLWLLAGAYNMGKCVGKNYIQLVPAKKVVKEVLDPNLDPKYKSLTEKGLKWISGKGWSR